MTVAFTQLGDTAASLTRDILGFDDAAFAQRLWEENSNFLCRRAGAADAFAPGYAVWIPEENPVMGADTAEYYMAHLDALSPRALEILSGLQEAGVTVPTLLNLHEFMCRFNAAFHESDEKHKGSQKHGMAATLLDEDSSFSQGVGFALVGSHSGLDLHVQSDKAFSGHVKRFKSALLQERSLRRARKQAAHAERAVLDDSIKTATINRENARMSLQSYSASRFSEREASYVFHKSERFFSNALVRKHWHFADVFDVHDLAKLGELLEGIGRVLVCTELVLDVVRLYENPKEREHWLYTVLSDLVESGFGYMLGSVLAVLLGGAIFAALPEILVVVVVGVAAGSIMFLLGHTVGVWIRDHSESFVSHDIQQPIDQLSAHIWEAI